MPCRVCPAKGGAGKYLAVCRTPVHGRLLRGGNIRQRGYQIEAGQKLSLVWQRNRRRRSKCRKNIEIEANPLGGEAPCADKGLDKESYVRLALLTDEFRILQATIYHS